MSEPFDSLIFDRNQSDVDHTAELRRKMQSGETLTAEEQEEYFSGLLKGSYNVNDMNRVNAAVRELSAMLTEVGYPVDIVEPRSLLFDDRYHKNSELQEGCYLYASGEYEALPNYVCTIDMIPIRAHMNSITVRTNITVGNDCGFVWYDNNGNYIGGTVGGARLIWDGCFQSPIPEGAAYFRANINADGITKAMIDSFVTRDYNGDLLFTLYIPDGTALCAYFSTNGEQYIDIGYKPRGMHTSITVSCSELSGTSPYYALFGSRDGNNKQFWSYYDDSVGSYGALVGRHNVTSLSYTITENLTFNQIVSSFYGNVFDVYIQQAGSDTLTAPEVDFDGEYSMYIFAVNNAGTAQYITSGNLEWIDIYEDDVCLRSLSPVADINLKAYLYDSVSGYSFLDQNGGKFVASEYDPTMYTAVPMSLDWGLGDIITQTAWEGYLKNIQALRDAFYSMPDSPALPEPTAPFTFDGANAIEKLLYDISQLYDAMKKMYRICGTFNASNDYLRQYIRSI